MSDSGGNGPQFGHGARDYDGRKELILKTAAVAFAQEGVQQVSLANLAERLGITKPALYHYVSGKDQMVMEILGISMARIERLFDRAHVRGENGREKLTIFIQNFCIYDDFDRCLTTIDLLALEPESQATHRKAQRQVVTELETIIREGIDDGSLRPCNERLLSLALLSAITGIGKWFRPEGTMPIEDITDTFLDFFLNGVLPQP